MPLLVDFTNVKGLEPLPDGNYLAKVVHSEEGLSAAGQPKIEMRWEIIAPEAHAGRQVFDILSFHPDAMYRTKGAIVAMGFDDTFQGEITAESLMDKEATLTLTTEQSTQRDDNGDAYPPRNKIRKFRSASKYGANGSNPALEGLIAPAAEQIKAAKPRK